MESKISAPVLQRRPLPRNFHEQSDSFTGKFFDQILQQQKVRTSKKPQNPNAKNYRKKDRPIGRASADVDRTVLEAHEIINCLKPLGPNPFPRPLRKPPWQFNRKKLTADPEFFFEQPFMFPEKYNGLPQLDILECMEPKSESYSMKLYPSQSDIQNKELHILNVHETEDLEEISPRKPWRQVILEEKQKRIALSPLPFHLSMIESFKNDIIHTTSGEQYHLSKLEELLELNKDLNFEDLKEPILHDNNDFTNWIQDDRKDLESFLNCHEMRQAGNKEIDSVLKHRYETGELGEMHGPLCRLNESDLCELSSEYCLNMNETKLDLKAYFIDTLVELPRPLFFTLVWVNLSFNNFTDVPKELFEAKKLLSLNLRNNPLSSLPKGFAKLKHLKYLNMSFCCLTNISESVHHLTELEILDVSHNQITHIDEDIKNLRCLKELYVVGNYIRTFPTTILELNLNILRCHGNLTNKLFWKESAPNMPQSLGDIAATCLARDGRFEKGATEEYSNCGYCNAEKSCIGIPVIKPVAEVFGQKNLPLLFYVCTQTCRKHLLLASQLPATDS